MADVRCSALFAGWMLVHVGTGRHSVHRCRAAIRYYACPGPRTGCRVRIVRKVEESHQQFQHTCQKAKGELSQGSFRLISTRTSRKFPFFSRFWCERKRREAKRGEGGSSWSGSLPLPLPPRARHRLRSEHPERVSKSSSSSISSSTQESEEELTIGTLITKATNTTNSAKSLGRRLSHLDSIPHTPRVNGKIPDFNNATIDHESLLERLGTYGLAEYQIEGDGNCQFRALADQIFRNPDYHKHVRKAVVKQLKEFKKHYEGYVPMEYKVYLKKMKRSGEWGDHVTLQAAADRFAAKICLLTSFRDTCLVEIVPRDATPTRELWLSFWCEVHYNSLYAVEDLPTRKTKKKHWLF